jgi:prepilin signal peptidase PulO-like enzyme (type II secretory pathway)
VNVLVLLLLSVVGLVAGSFLNAAIYALAWFSRPISPWQAAHGKAPPRVVSDYVPVVGWLGLARESHLHGPGHWIRPLLIEIACAFGLPALYWWEMTGHLAPLLPILGLAPPPPAMLFHQFVSHAILIGLMLVATFIDFDEQTIPDEITVPGTIMALLLAALWPDSHLPVVRPDAVGVPTYLPLLVTSSSNWPAWLDTWLGAAIGIAIFSGWCAALAPATATLRRGWSAAVRYYMASLFRTSAWWKLSILGVLGSAAIVAVWSRGGAPWQALFTSLVGLAFGGGLIWGVRVAGWVALRKEAMGFGDVTLMCMIGAFLGWQPALMVFFLSPFAALLVAVAQVLLSGRRDLAFGPYLCVAALYVLLNWAAMWNYAHGIFELGWMLPGIVLVCLLLMGVMLIAWRMIEAAMFSEAAAGHAGDQRK